MWCTYYVGTAYCTGRGEIIEPLPALPEWQNTIVHVFKPIEGLSTALVCKTLQLDSCSPVVPDSLLDCFVTKGALQSATDGRLVNDLEKPAFTCNPYLESLKNDITKELNNIAVGVMMSGSGTSIYALVAKEQSNNDDVSKKDKLSEEAINNILQKYPTVKHFKCDFMNKSDDLKCWYE